MIARNSLKARRTLLEPYIPVSEYRILGMQLDTTTRKDPVSCQHRKAQVHKYATYLAVSVRPKLRSHGPPSTKSCQILRARQKSPELRGRVNASGRGCIRSVCRITAIMRRYTAQICGAETQKPPQREVVGRRVQERSATSGLR